MNQPILKTFYIISVGGFWGSPINLFELNELSVGESPHFMTPVSPIKIIMLPINYMLWMVSP